MSRRVLSAIALSIGLLLAVAEATAQVVPAARIEILPSATPSVSDNVIARISVDQPACYSFSSSVTAQPGGVFEVRIVPLTALEILPCTQTFDVDLGVLPQGNYSVFFYTISAVLASASFTVGVAPIPALGEGGIGALAAILALVVIVVGAKTRGKIGSSVFRAALLLSGAISVGVFSSVSPVAAAEVVGRGIATDLIVRFDRKVEARSVSEIVDSVNTRRDFSLSSRLLEPSFARRLIRREPTPYERDIIAKYPSALVSQMFEYVVLSYDNVPDLRVVAESLRRVSSIQSVERVQAIKPSSIDPLLGTSNGTSNDSQWGMHALALPSAWLITKGRATIAYYDSGLVTGHEDLAVNYRPHLSRNVTLAGLGSKVASNLEDEHYINDTSPTNYPGHGTHVAGILVATTDNGIGVSGGCPSCSLIAIKDSRIGTDGFSNAIDHAIRSGAQVFNFSGVIDDAPCNTPQTDPRSWCTALGRAREAGISVIAAAGNDAGFGGLNFR